MMLRKRKRLWGWLLAVVLMVTQIPAVALAEHEIPQNEGGGGNRRI